MVIVGIIFAKNDLIIFESETPIHSSHQAGVSACVPGYIMMDWEEADLDKPIVSFTEIAFSRTSPQQKLSIVVGYQRAGNVVGVTGWRWCQ